MSSSQSRREAIPALASTFCNRSALNASSFCENNKCEVYAFGADQRQRMLASAATQKQEASSDYSIYDLDT